MAITLKEELIILCEGAADVEFFKALVSERQNMPRFDILSLEGRDKIDGMLKAIRAPITFPNVKGIVIAIDSRDNPEDTFREACDKIRQAGNYSIPPALSMPSATGQNCPPITIICIPGDARQGGIETLYVDEIESKRGWIRACVDGFFSCGGIAALSWSAEKLGKARFHSMVAALYEIDPSRAASYIWKQRDAAPLLMDIHAPCFDGIAEFLRDFASAMGVV